MTQARGANALIFQILTLNIRMAFPKEVLLDVTKKDFYSQTDLREDETEVREHYGPELKGV